MAEPSLAIEVAYADENQPCLFAVQVPPGSTVAQVLALSAVLSRLPVWHVDAPVGIFGRRVEASTCVVQDGDRIELYRPLLADPKEVRRLRAAKARP